jgi:predicted nucleic acid-binding protein
MKILKIYLDTSVILMFDDDISPRGIITKEFFKRVLEKKHNLIISEVVEYEITDTTDELKKESNKSFLSTLNCQILSYSKASHDLAWSYVFDGVLTHNHIDDLLHVAYATVHECDVIVSWNRKHIAKPAKIQKLNFCNVKNNYHVLRFVHRKNF